MAFKKQKMAREESIIIGNPSFISAEESINRLKDNLLYAAVDGKIKILQFESSLAGEAKTTTCINLAVSLGKTGKKTLIIDFDFRKPRVHRAFQLENANGISDYMIGSITKEVLVKPTEFENVSIITRGTKVENSAAILMSDKLQNLMKELRDEYDFILLDCPPVLIISDYINISRISDGVIFNVAYAATKRNQVKEAIGLLRQNNIPIIGAVFTFFDSKKANNYGEYNSYYYYYSSNYGDRK